MSQCLDPGLAKLGTFTFYTFTHSFLKLRPNTQEVKLPYGDTYAEKKIYGQKINRDYHHS